MRLSFLFAALACSPVFAQNAAVFSEDFESGKIDPAKWETRATGAATLTVEAVPGARGKNALHAHYPEMTRGAYAFIVNPKLPESLRTHFFGRAWVKTVAPADAPHTVFIFSGETGYPISKFEEIGVYKGTWQPSFQENKSARGQGRGEAVAHAVNPLPSDKWFLLEWEFNDAPNSMTLWVDGEKVDTFKFVWPKGSETTDNLVGGFTELGVGVRVWGMLPGAFDVYYDDIAVGPQRLGSK